MGPTHLSLTSSSTTLPLRTPTHPDPADEWGTGRDHSGPDGRQDAGQGAGAVGTSSTGLKVDNETRHVALGLKKKL